LARADSESDYINAIKADVNPSQTDILVVVMSKAHLKAKVKKFIDSGGIPS